MSVAKYIVELLLTQAPASQAPVGEASVHRPRRGNRWVAHYTGPESGQQIWRSTKLSDYDQALAVAKKWERQAKAQRMAQRAVSRTPTLRVRRSEKEASPGLLTQREVGLLLGMSERAVRDTEKRALNKLRNHPLLKEIWEAYLASELGEAVEVLTSAERAALLGLARSPSELCVMQKVLSILAR